MKIALLVATLCAANFCYAQTKPIVTRPAMDSTGTMVLASAADNDQQKFLFMANDATNGKTILYYEIPYPCPAMKVTWLMCTTRGIIKKENDLAMKFTFVIVCKDKDGTKTTISIEYDTTAKEWSEIFHNQHQKITCESLRSS